MKCILIETKDKRRFLTHEKNLSNLKSFLDTFEAKITKVDHKKGKILDLKELAIAICDASYNKENLEYDLPKRSIDKDKPSTLIKNFIYNSFINNKTISIKVLKEKFQDLKLCDATFYNHIKKVKEILEKQGLKIIRISPGQFKALKN